MSACFLFERTTVCASIISHLFGLFHNSLLLDFFLKALTESLGVLKAAEQVRSRSLQHMQLLLPPPPPEPHLILLLLHFSQQEFRVDVALLEEMLQPLVAHVVGVPLPGLASLVRCVVRQTRIHVFKQRLTG